AGVALLQDIKTMFGASTLDHLTSRAIIHNLTADPEKRWAEWSRGKPITEKGVAALLHEYHIISKTVGPRDSHARGYRKADCEEAWARYLSPTERGDGGPDSAILPLIRLRPCSDNDFAEKTAVDHVDRQREKIEHFSSEINAVNASTGKSGVPTPSSPFTDSVTDSVTAEMSNGDGQAKLQKCNNAADHSEDALGKSRFREDREVPADRRPALGPAGDSLDDLK